MWYELEETGHSDSSVLLAKARVPSDSPWFCGHFPGEPILPGIAQLGMVFDAITRGVGRKLVIRSVSRVRFKQAVRPGDRLEIVAAPRKDEVESYRFRITIEKEVVCSGVMTFQGSPESKESEREEGARAAPSDGQSPAPGGAMAAAADLSCKKRGNPDVRQDEYR